MEPCQMSWTKLSTHGCRINYQQWGDMIYVSKKRSSIMNSCCFGEYQAMALAEPRTCNAYSMANMGSSRRTFQQSWFLKSTEIPESTLKLKGPAICKQTMFDKSKPEKGFKHECQHMLQNSPI